MRAIEALAHLTLRVDDLDSATSDYQTLFGVPADVLPAGDGQVFHAFQTGNVGLRFRRTRSGETPGLAAMTFRVTALDRAAEALFRCGLPTDGGRLDTAATHGIPMTLVETAANLAPSGAVLLDHIVIRTPAPERAVALYGGRLGLDMRLDRSNPAWNARLMFFRCGDLVIEIAHVLSDGVSDAPDAFGGLSWRVPDIDATHAQLSGRGFDLSPVRTGRRPGSRVCTMRNHTAGVPTILLGVTPRD